MNRRRVAGILALAAVVLLAVLAAGCGGGGDEGGGDTAPSDTGAPPTDTGAGGEGGAGGSGSPQAGGTYRVGWEASFDFTDAFDVTGEYTATGWALYTLLVRKLVTYPGAEGAEGNTVVPDLATDTGQVSEDGLTWTFTLKDGIMFGPPVNREITSQDVKAAFDRIANPDIGSFGYPNYYTPITGFQDVIDGKADTVSGIETPDDKTIVFTARHARRRLPLPARDAGGGADPARSDRLLHEGRRLRPLPDRFGPVHDRGFRPARHHELRHDEGDLRLQPGEVPEPRAQPELRPGDGLAGGALELPGSLRARHQLERGRHLRAGRRKGSSTRRSRVRRASRSRSTRRTRICRT